MAVRKLLSRTSPAQRPARATAAAEHKERLAALRLPTERKQPLADILAYTGLLYGREKIGKTTALAGFPDAIFLTTEPGTKGASVFEFNADGGGTHSWDVFLRAVQLLEEAGAGHPFRTVVVDTADRAYDICLDHVCQRLGVAYPGVGADGKNDYGKSWRAVRQEFLGAVHRLEQAGYGVWFTSHAAEQEFETRGGENYTRIHPSMSKQARGVIEAVVDFFFYAEYMRSRDGTVERVLICQGDETIWAGARATPQGTFPRFLPLRKEETFEVLQRAFNGQESGIDPGTLMAERRTTATAKEFVNKQRARESLARVKGGAVQSRIAKKPKGR